MDRSIDIIIMSKGRRVCRGGKRLDASHSTIYETLKALVLFSAG